MNQYVHSGMSLGATLAVVISWSLHKSVVWAVLHGLFGWFYVAYFVFTRWIESDD